MEGNGVRRTILSLRLKLWEKKVWYDCPNEWETFLTKKFLGNHNNFRELKKFFLIIQFLNFLWTICRLQFARCLDWEIVCQRIGLFAYLSKAVLLGRRAVHRRRPDSKIKSSWCLRDRRPRANCTATLFAVEKIYYLIQQRIIRPPP